MNKADIAILQFGVMAFFGLMLILFIGSGATMDVGCHILGTEVNGDLTTEYLLVGNC